MEENLFYEETQFESLKSTKSRSKRNISISLIILIISSLASLFLYGVLQNSIQSAAHNILALLAFSLVLSFSALIFLVTSIVLYLLARNKKTSSNMGRVEVNTQGIALDDNFFPWESIHSLRRFGSGWTRTAEKAGSVYLASQGTIVPSNNRWTYTLQTSKGKFYYLAIMNKEAFESSLKKIGKEQLLTTPEKFVPNSIVVAIAILAGVTLLLQGNYLAGENQILQIALPVAGLVLLIASIWYWNKKKRY